jgi:hypothetical protein
MRQVYHPTREIHRARIQGETPSDRRREARIPNISVAIAVWISMEMRAATETLIKTYSGGAAPIPSGNLAQDRIVRLAAGYFLPWRWPCPRTADYFQFYPSAALPPWIQQTGNRHLLGFLFGIADFTVWSCDPWWQRVPWGPERSLNQPCSLARRTVGLKHLTRNEKARRLERRAVCRYIKKDVHEDARGEDCISNHLEMQVQLWWSQLYRERWANQKHYFLNGNDELR